MSKSPLRTALASEVKRLRSERGLSQAALAESSGLTQAAISLIEQESGNPTLDTIEQLSKSLKAVPRFTLSPAK